MAYVDVNGGNGHHKFRLTVWENSYNKETQKSNIGYTLTIRPIQTGYDFYWGHSLTYGISIGGNVVSGDFGNYDGSSEITIKEGTIDLTRTESDNNVLVSSFNFYDDTGQTYTPGNCYGQCELNLTEAIFYKEIYTKIDGSWIKGVPFIKVNDNWIEAKNIFVKVGSTWKKV